jgi:hypothetical protein
MDQTNSGYNVYHEVEIPINVIFFENARILHSRPRVSSCDPKAKERGHIDPLMARLL